ncbi:DUF3145 family protein [Streptomyces sp. NPDC087532]|uniref:DUF3145 family protein n=1 Tax=Streptomyces sp. NPDC087532 TaxID=3365795 RepID=UPI003823A020
MLSDHLPALQITIHATTSSDFPAVLHALNTHHLTTDFTADTTHPLTDLQPGHTYVTRASADTAEHLATTLITTAPNTAFELSGDPAETQDGVSIAYHPDTGLFRAQCNADGTPLIPAEEVRHALAQAPTDMGIGIWLALYAPALLGTRVRAALARTKAHPQHTARHTNQTPDHGQDVRCGACGTTITWYHDDPDADTPHGHWFDSEDRDLCPATDEDADDPGHTPAPTPADFHQATLYLPPDPADRDHSFPITAMAGLRIATYIDDTYTLNIGILNDTVHPALRTTPDGQLAVDLRIGCRPLPAPGHSTNAPTSTGVLTAIKKLVDYNWNTERADFDRQDTGGQANHIFHALTQLRGFLNVQDQPTPRPGTTFPADLLPAVPEDRWNTEKVSDTTVDDDGQLATTVYTLDAPTADEAERRLLAWINHDHQDDLNDATATATRPSQPGHYTVYLTQPVRY